MQNRLFNKLPDYINNNFLYEENFIANQLENADINDSITLKVFELLNDSNKINFDLIKDFNEANLRYEFFNYLLKNLGWESLVEININNKLADYGLFIEEESKKYYINTRDLNKVDILFEAKKYQENLNKNENQLISYLANSKKNYGFLSNGKLWRIYYNDLLSYSEKKRYLEFNLEEIISLKDKNEKLKSLALFCYFFGAKTHKLIQLKEINKDLKTIESLDDLKYINKEKNEKISELDLLLISSEKIKEEAEKNLKDIIYGQNNEECLFELIGQSIKENLPNSSDEEIYDNSIILLFRLLFIIYFEDKHFQILAKHKFYNEKFSLNYRFLESNFEKIKFKDFNYYYKDLNYLFKILNEGDTYFRVPLLNGVLFDNNKNAELLNNDDLITNENLHKILTKLLFKTRNNELDFKIKRDYKNMSVTHIGSIYEGLLEYKFFTTKEELIYAKYKADKSEFEEYFNLKDYEQLIKSSSTKNIKILNYKEIPKNQLIIKNNKNSRKTSASYYTPSELSSFLVKKAIDNILENNKNKKEIYELKIIDNSCGSGHFLVESLNYLTEKSIEELNKLEEKSEINKIKKSKNLQDLINEEKIKIYEELDELKIETYQVSNEQVLKRFLLKNCIYGVDLNPFAVELTRLSLWLDSFIFGTPLSFIEHHIKHGNSLIGYSSLELNKFIDNYNNETKQGLLFEENLKIDLNELNEIQKELNEIKDTTKEDIENSKNKFKELKPKLDKLNQQFNLVNYLNIKEIEEELKKENNFNKLEKIKLFFSEKFKLNLKEQKEKEDLINEINIYNKKYNFFNYEVEFPEVFTEKENGFDIIVGNPPWDKIKFDEAEFFNGFTNYKYQKESEKTKIKNEILKYENNRKEFENQKENFKILTTIYKNNYPLNKGSGDTNIFRLFVEKNLNLLANNGNLNYCLPSALMLEEGSTILRKYILDNKTLNYFYSFENQAKIFPDVAPKYKVALIQIINKKLTKEEAENHEIKTAFYLTRAEQINGRKAEKNKNEEIIKKSFNYPLKTLRKISPKFNSIMELNNKKDLFILEKLYSKFNKLNPNYLDFRRELDLTNDKDLFIETTNPSGLLPLYEGKMIWQFNSKYINEADLKKSKKFEPKYYLNKGSFDERLKSKEFYRMSQNLNIKIKKNDKKFYEKFIKYIRYNREFFRLAFRTIAGDTNERSLVSCLIFKNIGLANSLNVSIPKKYKLEKEKIIIQEESKLKLLFILTLFNSIIFDWLIRRMVQININKTYIYRLAVPQPKDKEILNNKYYKILAKNGLILSLINDFESFEELFLEFKNILEINNNILGVKLENKEDFLRIKFSKNNLKNQDKLKAENDKIVYNLYGLTREDFLYILEDFKVLKNKNPEYFKLFSK